MCKPDFPFTLEELTQLKEFFEHQQLECQSIVSRSNHHRNNILRVKDKLSGFTTQSHIIKSYIDSNNAAKRLYMHIANGNPYDETFQFERLDNDIRYALNEINHLISEIETD